MVRSVGRWIAGDWGRGVREKHTLGLADGGVDDLEDRDGECRSFTGTRLSLGDGVSAFAYLDDSTRLHGRRGLVAICVNSTEEVFCAHVVLVKESRRKFVWGGGTLEVHSLD